MNAYSTTISLEGLDNKQFFILISEAAANLGWQFNFTDAYTAVLTTPRSAWSWGEEISVAVKDDLANIKSKGSVGRITGKATNRQNVDDLCEQLILLRGQVTPEALTEKAHQLQQEQEAYTKDFEKRYIEGDLTASEKISLGVGGHTITYALIGINVLVFIIMALSGVSLFEPTGLDILKWGGNIRSYTSGGEWWRLVTCTFVHIGIIHLLMNMYALYFLGSYLEPLIGRWRYLLVYLCTGTLASVTSIWWSGDRVSAGASGAIFGLLGVFIALLTTHMMDKTMRKGLLQSMLIFAGYNLMYGMKGGVDNSAHIGGLISGFLLGYITYVGLKKESLSKLSIAIIAGITFIISAGYINVSKDDSLKYEAIIQQFSVNEEKALKPLQNAQQTDTLAMQQALKNVILPAWEENKKLLAQTLSFKLASKPAEQRQLIQEYIDLRIEEATQLLHSYRHESRNAGEPSFDDVENQLQEKLAAIENLSKSK